jgi:cyclophilin family peptidyl-prolyl cis-trans isomerase
MCVSRAFALLFLVLALPITGCKDEPAKPPPSPGTFVLANVRSTEPAIAAIQDYIERNLQSRRIDRTAPDWRLSTPMRPKVSFSASRTYVWTLDTEFGAVQIRLRADTAPEHVANVVYLTLLGFFDGLAIHRIVPGKALETGDPAEDGKGGPGYAFSPETNAAKHDRRGLVSAVSMGDSTDDSKFRITFAADSSIPAHSTLFGDVESGLEVLQKIESLGSPDGKPTRHIAIRTARISIR